MLPQLLIRALSSLSTLHRKAFIRRRPRCQIRRVTIRIHRDPIDSGVAPHRLTFVPRLTNRTRALRGLEDSQLHLATLAILTEVHDLPAPDLTMKARNGADVQTRSAADCSRISKLTC